MSNNAGGARSGHTTNNNNIANDSLGGLMGRNMGGLVQGAIFGAIFMWGPSLSWWQWVAICFVGFIGMLYFKQTSMLYPRCAAGMPKTPADNPPNFRHPGEYDITYEDVYMDTADGCRLHAWLMLHKAPREVPTVLFFHGNAGNIGYRLPLLKELFCNGKMNIFAIDYRGYGFSDGEPSEPGLKVDGVTALDWLRGRQDIDPTKIIVFGKSLGGAVAVSLAVERPTHIRGVILENTYSNIVNLSQDLFPLVKALKCVLPRLLHNKWDSVGIIDQIRVPIQFISGKQDNIIKPRHMKMLCEKAMCTNANNISFASLQGGHNNVPLVAGAVYQETINAFLKQFDLANDLIDEAMHQESRDDNNVEGRGKQNTQQDSGAVRGSNASVVTEKIDENQSRNDARTECKS